jgi:hypothetical protein
MSEKVKPLCAAILIGFGLGVIANSVDWEKVRGSTEGMASTAVSLLAIASGAGLALNSQSIPLVSKKVNEKAEPNAGEETK